MSLEFEGDAICLSGLTGTKMKTDVIGDYYDFWWGITSGGANAGFRNPTSIVELDAATGEVCIEGTKDIVLGSAGHALKLKMDSAYTYNLKVILVEKDANCYSHLKKVISKRWNKIPLKEVEGPIEANTSKVYLLNNNLDEALEKIEKIPLGNSLFFFDPLRSVRYETIEKVASKRINTFYKSGTEFFIFIFTSDWFLGRDDFAPLPKTTKENAWSTEERKTVQEADSLFGSQEWRNYVLNEKSIEERERTLIDLYKSRLHKWFRYVLPLPFKPKGNQNFHLILCSNFEVGVVATKNFYSKKTKNEIYSPDNAKAFERFKKLHGEIFRGLGRERPIQWKILWAVIKYHEGGYCDFMCKDFTAMGPDTQIQESLDWLEEKGYLNLIKIDNAWNSKIKQYRLNWNNIKEKLKINPPEELEPLSPEHKNGK